MYKVFIDWYTTAIRRWHDVKRRSSANVYKNIPDKRSGKISLHNVNDIYLYFLCRQVYYEKGTMIPKNMPYDLTNHSRTNIVIPVLEYTHVQQQLTVNNHIQWNHLNCLVGWHCVPVEFMKLLFTGAVELVLSFLATSFVYLNLKCH